MQVLLVAAQHRMPPPLQRLATFGDHTHVTQRTALRHFNVEKGSTDYPEFLESMRLTGPTSLRFFLETVRDKVKAALAEEGHFSFTKPSYLQQKLEEIFRTNTPTLTALDGFLWSIHYYQECLHSPLYDPRTTEQFWSSGHARTLMQRCVRISESGFCSGLARHMEVAGVEGWQTGCETSLELYNTYNRALPIEPSLQDRSPIRLYSNPVGGTCKLRFKAYHSVLVSTSPVWCVPHPLWLWTRNAGNPGTCRLDIECAASDILRVQRMCEEHDAGCKGQFTPTNIGKPQDMVFVVLRDTTEFVVGETREVRAVLLNTAVGSEDMSMVNQLMKCIECKTPAACTPADIPPFAFERDV